MVLAMEWDCRLSSYQVFDSSSTKHSFSGFLSLTSVCVEDEGVLEAKSEGWCMKDGSCQATTQPVLSPTPSIQGRPPILELTARPLTSPLTLTVPECSSQLPACLHFRRICGSLCGIPRVTFKAVKTHRPEPISLGCKDLSGDDPEK